MASYSRKEAITVKTKVAERMMSMISVQEMGAVLKAKLPQLQAALARGLDFAEVERGATEDDGTVDGDAAGGALELR
jgi:hypothetical protein